MLLLEANKISFYIAFDWYLVSKTYGEDTLNDDADPNRIVQCPYDKNHQIRASRFPFHVLKCRKVGNGRGNVFQLFHAFI